MNPYIPILTRTLSFFASGNGRLRRRVLRLRLLFCKDRTGNCPIQAKRKQRRLSELLSICWVHIWTADFWNAMHVHSDFLINSSPAEGKVRSIGGNCSRWRMRASCVITLAVCLTDLRGCQYEIATCNEEKFDTGPPDLDKFVQIQQQPKSTFVFFTKNKYFFPWTYNFLGLWSSWYITWT